MKEFKVGDEVTCKPYEDAYSAVVAEGVPLRWNPEDKRDLYRLTMLPERPIRHPSLTDVEWAVELTGHHSKLLKAKEEALSRPDRYTTETSGESITESKEFKDYATVHSTV